MWRRTPAPRQAPLSGPAPSRKRPRPKTIKFCHPKTRLRASRDESKEPNMSAAPNPGQKPPIAAEAFLRALADHGVDYMFANPGTDFPPIVEAFSRAKKTNAKVPKPVLVPHENLAVAMRHGDRQVFVRHQHGLGNLGVGLLGAAEGFHDGWEIGARIGEHVIDAMVGERAQEGFRRDRRLLSGVRGCGHVRFLAFVPGGAQPRFRMAEFYCLWPRSFTRRGRA